MRSACALMNSTRYGETFDVSVARPVLQLEPGARMASVSRFAQGGLIVRPRRVQG